MIIQLSMRCPADTTKAVGPETLQQKDVCQASHVCWSLLGQLAGWAVTRGSTNGWLTCRRDVAMSVVL